MNKLIAIIAVAGLMGAVGCTSKNQGGSESTAVYGNGAGESGATMGTSTNNSSSSIQDNNLNKSSSSGAAENNASGSLNNANGSSSGAGTGWVPERIPHQDDSKSHKKRQDRVSRFIVTVHLARKTRTKNRSRTTSCLLTSRPDG